MSKQSNEILDTMALQEKQLDAMYRKAASAFGLSECGMWILYFLSSSNVPLTQFALIQKMAFPKQTINSSVAMLARTGYLTIELISSSRKSKNLILTPEGKRLCAKTVKKIRKAEQAAVDEIGEKEMREFLRTERSFYEKVSEHLADEKILKDVNQR